MSDQTNGRTRPERVRSWLSGIPSDLTVVLVVVALANFSFFVSGLDITPLRIFVGLPFILFVPGYAVLAALFPEAGGASGFVSSERDSESESARGIGGIERMLLSLVLSVGISVLIGFTLNFTVWGIRLVPVAIGISAVTIVCTLIAAWRRSILPTDDRFTVTNQNWFAVVRSGVFDADTTGERILNSLLVLAVLLTVLSAGYAVTANGNGSSGEQFTEFYLVTENTSGQWASNYPTQFTVGEPRSLTVGVTNHERRSQQYTILVQLQEISRRGNTMMVHSNRTIDSLETRRLEPNTSWQHTHAVAPTMAGERLRLVYLLYRGDPPADPTARNAYRELHLWVNVSV